MNLPEEVVIDIAEHLRAEVARIEILRQHHMQQLQSLGAELRTLIRHGHGVDIAEPGWVLDAEGGKIARVPRGGGAPAPATVPALSVVPNSPPEADTPDAPAAE